MNLARPLNQISPPIAVYKIRYQFAEDDRQSGLGQKLKNFMLSK